MDLGSAAPLAAPPAGSQPDPRTDPRTDPRPGLDCWLRERDLASLGDPAPAAVAFRDLVADGLLRQPVPGSGRTAERFDALAALGRADLVLARLAEGHLDALAVLAELDGPDPGAGAWGVWAANPPDATLRAERRAAAWLISGDKPWCSGAGACTHALVTAPADDGYRLFAVELDPATAHPVDGTWPALGMAGSDSRTMRFDAAPATAVGPVDGYLARPGFWWGAVGVAAVWHGGAAGVADALLAAQRKRPLHEHALAHLGAVDAALHASRAVLAEAAERLDDRPDLVGPPAEALARRARAVVERTATEVVDRVGRALGATPLALDARHSRRVADLTVFLRQSHAEKDLAALAGSALAAGTSW